MMRINGKPSGDKIKMAEYKKMVSVAGSDLENKFYGQLINSKLPDPEREHKFCDHRRWRFDFAWPDIKIAAEVEGGTWSSSSKSRHTTGSGFHKDCEKYNQATLDGWRVFRFDSTMISSGQALGTITTAIMSL